MLAGKPARRSGRKGRSGRLRGRERSRHVRPDDLGQYLNLEVTRISLVDPDEFGGFDEVGVVGVVDVWYVALRVAVEGREPTTLDLHHDAVTPLERVQHVLE